MRHASTKQGVEEKCFHLREEILNDEGSVISHVPFATVYFRRDVNKDAVWQGSISICSEGDNFSYEKGRNIARRHWMLGNRVAVPDATYEEAVRIYDGEYE